MLYYSVDLLVNKNGLCIVFAVSLSFHIYIFLYTGTFSKDFFSQGAVK